MQSLKPMQSRSHHSQSLLAQESALAILLQERLPILTPSRPYDMNNAFEDHRHDQEASSRMDNEGCPNGDNEDDRLAEELSQDADTSRKLESFECMQKERLTPNGHEPKAA
jgi:hypothetical protein